MQNDEAHTEQSTTNRNPKGTDPRTVWRLALPIGKDMQALVELVGWNAHATLTGVNIKSDDDGWLVILKAKKNGKAVVHFTGARTWNDALEVLIYEITHDMLTWREDKYA